MKINYLYVLLFLAITSCVGNSPFSKLNRSHNTIPLADSAQHSSNSQTKRFDSGDIVRIHTLPNSVFLISPVNVSDRKTGWDGSLSSSKVVYNFLKPIKADESNYKLSVSLENHYMRSATESDIAQAIKKNIESLNVNQEIDQNILTAVYYSDLVLRNRDGSSFNTAQTNSISSITAIPFKLSEDGMSIRAKKVRVGVGFIRTPIKKFIEHE